LWAPIYEDLRASTESAIGAWWVAEPWNTILRNHHVRHQHRMLDEYDNSAKVQIAAVIEIFASGDYLKIFDFLTFVLRHPKVPYEMDRKLEHALRISGAAYTIIGRDTFAPFGSEAERAAVARAFVDLHSTELNGARAHLRAAAEALTASRYADSVRESAQALESVSRVIEPGATTLSPALAKLEQRIGIHPALRKGFANLYGFTSSEKGIRHPLLEKGSADVDEADALYMMGACAAFVSYVVNKARAAGLLGQGGLATKRPKR